MRITLAEGMHYCYDCGELVIDTDHDSVWYCPKCAKKRGWNIIDGKRIRIKDGQKQDISAGEGQPKAEN